MHSSVKRLCVFCGSSLGKNPAYRQNAAQLGQLLAEEEVELVYGGGNCGLMGVLADETLKHGGRVTGIIPEDLLSRELGHNRLTQLHVVRSMHERKALMIEMADGFAALPGGFGTLEELFEVITWAQLGLHNKPIGLLNVEGYFDSIVRLMDHTVEQDFVRPKHRERLLISKSASELLDGLRGFQRPTVTEDSRM